uniref:Uncharacterized protein n=1 Tax=Oryza punctata TaxID=4537 RepID=A0A0E0LH61_ORYPU
MGDCGQEARRRRIRPRRGGSRTLRAARRRVQHNCRWEARWWWIRPSLRSHAHSGDLRGNELGLRRPWRSSSGHLNDVPPSMPRADLNPSEAEVAKQYPSHTAICICDGLEFCSPGMCDEGELVLKYQWFIGGKTPPDFVPLPEELRTGCPKVINLTAHGDLVEGNVLMGVPEMAWCNGTSGKGVARFAYNLYHVSFCK